MTMTTRSFNNNTSSNGNKFKLFIFVIISSTYFWKLFMCTIFTTILIRQYTNTYHNIHGIIHNTDDAGYSSLQQQQKSLSLSLSLLSSSSSSIIEDDVNNNNVNSNVKLVLAPDGDHNVDHNKPLLPLPLLSNSNLNLDLDLNLNLNLGVRWKKSVQSKLKEQEKVRSRGIKNQDEKLDIQSNFKRLNNRLNEINTTIEIDNPQNWHTVTSKSYEKIRRKAHQSIKNDLRLSNKIHTDCILWLVPPSTTASSSSLSSSSTNQKNTNIIRAFQDENDGQDRDNYNKRKDQTTRRKSNIGPQIKFQCDLNNTSEVLVLQDAPCSRSANLCRVETNILVWNDYYENMNMNMNNATTVSSSSSSSSTYFNYTKIKESILMIPPPPPPPSSINSSSSSKSTTHQSSSKPKSKSSTLLTMVDTIQYLKCGHQYIWECFLNKASYSLRTKQTFYIWIGTLELKSESESKSESSVVVEENNNKNENEKNSSSFTTHTNTNTTLNSTSNNILHQRNTDTIYKTFGTKCNPESMTTNTINYYKPIAFITLFQKLLSLDNNNIRNNNEEQVQEQEEQRVWFVDADIFFNEEAYPTTTPNNNNNNNNNSTEDEVNNEVVDNTTTTDSDLPLLQSLDDYFELSTTAIIFGAQNPSGKSENILLNGGLLGLRLHAHAAMSSSSSSSLSSNKNEVEIENEWNVFDFASLWWYCRCGERDQIALWLVLFATWSAESNHSSSTSSASSSSSALSSSSAHTTTTSTNNKYDPVVSSIQQQHPALPFLFSYPGVIFENYLFSWYGVIPHIHQYLQQKLNNNNNNNNNRIQPVQQQQQNVPQHQVVNNQFNGGREFLNSKYGNAIFTYPLELPHLLVLPLDPFQVRSSTTTTTPTTTTSTSSQQSTSTSQPPPFQEEKKKTTSSSRTNFNLGIIKKNQSDKKALLSHNKNMYNTCYNYKCYPYYL